MKAIYIILGLFFVLVVSIGLLNLFSMFDEENCVCLENIGKCQIYEEIENAKPRRDYQRSCGESECKYFFGRCYKLHRYLDITYIVRGR